MHLPGSEPFSVLLIELATLPQRWTGVFVLIHVICIRVGLP